MTGLLTGSPASPPPLGPDHSHDSLVVVSHRGPAQFTRTDGRRSMRRNAGGLVTALRDAAHHVDETRWICAAASTEDHVIARTTPWTTVDRCDVHMLDLDRAAHCAFYGVIANPLLWFVQHQIAGARVGSREWSAWQRGYVPINHAFADAVRDDTIVPPDSIVMVHDYHLYLVPELVRATRPDLFLHFFTHIPWPGPDAWRVLPAPMRDAVFTGVLGSDIAGFQTARDATNFLLGCRDLLGLNVDLRHSSVTVDTREVAVRHYPISVDAAGLRAQVLTSRVAEHRRALRDAHRGRLLLRVDRTDPSKNIVRGFEAFATMLENHPEQRGAVTFLALLQPSRQEVPEYATYLTDIQRTVAAINARFGRPGWTPIDLRLCEDLPLALAAYSMFDVLMVNPVADGMNLVAKEAMLVNQNDGVLALSMLAGAHDELGAAAVTLDPFDVPQQARALHDALVMPRAARRARHQVAIDIVRANDLEKWLSRQFADIELMRLAPELT